MYVCIMNEQFFKKKQINLVSIRNAKNKYKKNKTLLVKEMKMNIKINLFFL